MSQKNVELAQRGFDLVSRGDVAALMKLVGLGFELHENVLAPDAAVYRGSPELGGPSGACRNPPPPS